MMTWDEAPIQILLGPEIGDESSALARLNDSKGQVAACLDSGIVVVRPVRPHLVAGMPAYYSGRPAFRGKLRVEGDGRVILGGFVQQSAMPVLFNVIGAFFAAFGVLIGMGLIVSGDPTGLAAIASAAVIGVALLVGRMLVRRLSELDERTILSALRAIEYEGSHGS